MVKVTPILLASVLNEHPLDGGERLARLRQGSDSSEIALFADKERPSRRPSLHSDSNRSRPSSFSWCLEDGNACSPDVRLLAVKAHSSGDWRVRHGRYSIAMGELKAPNAGETGAAYPRLTRR